ncbi:unnamed protein product [Prunus armeniaca]|uniref:Uncharacterized protein n=1 Tax=Prunus armeniaca TaxID=36596 RepID=A0A6J5XVL4_PRUAR|nr:unnamed protein product [Prunus armeniaca]
MNVYLKLSFTAPTKLKIAPCHQVNLFICLGGGSIDQVEKRESPINQVETGRTTICENGVSCSLDPSLEIGRYKGLKTDGQITQRPLNSSSRALGAANRFIPKNPSFTATVGSTYQLLVCPEFHQREEANRDSSGWREIMACEFDWLCLKNHQLNFLVDGLHLRRKIV